MSNGNFIVGRISYVFFVNKCFNVVKLRTLWCGMSTRMRPVAGDTESRFYFVLDTRASEVYGAAGP